MALAKFLKETYGRTTVLEAVKAGGWKSPAGWHSGVSILSPAASLHCFIRRSTVMHKFSFPSAVVNALSLLVLQAGNPCAWPQRHSGGHGRIWQQVL